MRSDIENLLRYGNRKINPTFWCKKCNVPLIQEKCESCNKRGIIITESSMRPVFREELNIIRRQSKSRSKWLLLPDLSFWAVKRNYFYNGEKIFTNSGITNGTPFEIRHNKHKDAFLPKKPLKMETIIRRLKKANRSSLNRLEYRAIEFIEQAAKTFYGRLPVVSFSGGKDSCAVSHLVRLALGTKTIHIFGDTTIEYPDTYKFIEDFKRNNPTVPFLTAQPSMKFFELAEELGPPSRILRWCCTTHKTGPISNLMTSLDGNGVLTFDGIRKAESTRRSKYASITTKQKIKHQVLASPIIDWSDAELWLYILARDVHFCEGYTFGFTRIGCLYCPFEKKSQAMISFVKYKNKMNKWDNFLESFARKIGYKDISKFKDYGWKARAGARGIKKDPSSIHKKECSEEDNTYTYDLSYWDESFFEFFKPFGILSRIYDDGNEASYNMIDPKTNSIMFFLKIVRYIKHLRIVVFPQKNNKLLLSRIEGQIKRFQACILCGQCQSVCPSKASRQNTGQYYVDKNKCNSCMECIKKECLAVKTLKRNLNSNATP